MSPARRSAAGAWPPAKGGTAALRRRYASGRPPGLSPEQAARVAPVLLAGAKASGFATDLWTLDRIGLVIEQHTGVHLARSSVWRLLQRLGWSPQRPQRRAKEADEQAIARWVAHEWPRIKGGLPSKAPGSSSSTSPA